MVHEVVNRGDIFALNVKTGIFTIISGQEQVEFKDAVVVDETEYRKLWCQLHFNFAA